MRNKLGRRPTAVSQIAESLAAKLPLGDWRASAIRAWFRLQSPHMRGVRGLGALSMPQHHRRRRQNRARDTLETSCEYRMPPKKGVTAAVASGEKLFKQPSGKSYRGVGRRVRDGLRLCCLDMAVTTFSFGPSSSCSKPLRLCRGERSICFRQRLLVASRDKIQMDCTHMIRV
jgi:hypothetical protein